MSQYMVNNFGGGSGPVLTIDTDAGIANPLAGVINIVGINGITTTGAGNTVTIDGSGASDISITGDTGGALVGSAFTFTGGTTGLSFGGGGSTQTLTFAGITANGGAVNLGTDNAANGITIGTGTTGRLINIGLSAAPHVIVMGNTNTTTSMSLQSGTGNTVVNSAGTTTVTGTGGVSVNSISGAINIGDAANANAINLGTGAAARTITVGNTTGATDLDLRYGTGDYTLASATGTVMSALDTGEITSPLQPAFFAINSVTDSNVTGDGTVYTVLFNSEIYDQNADYDGTTGIFTAPVTGRYHFSIGVTVSGLTSAMTIGSLLLVTSNRNIRLCTNNIGAVMSVSNNFSIVASSYADMDVNDTAFVTVTISNGALVADILGDTPTASTFFGGKLVC